MSAVISGCLADSCNCATVRLLTRTTSCERSLSEIELVVTRCNTADLMISRRDAGMLRLALPSRRVRRIAPTRLLRLDSGTILAGTSLTAGATAVPASLGAAAEAPVATATGACACAQGHARDSAAMRATNFIRLLTDANSRDEVGIKFFDFVRERSNPARRQNRIEQMPLQISSQSFEKQNVLT